MARLFETAARISTPWALAAFAIAAIVFVLAKRRGKVPAIAWAGIGAIVLLGIVPILAQLRSAAIYHVRITVVGPDGTPVEDAKVWSAAGGEPKKVAGGWQFDIPAAAAPAEAAKDAPKGRRGAKPARPAPSVEVKKTRRRKTETAESDA